MSVIVVATIRPLPDCREAVVAALETAIARVHQDDEGCELYALHEATDRLVVIEKWTSEDALAAHAKGPATTELGAALHGKLDGSVVLQLLEPRPAGSASLGTL
jgi:quinol monooxygenase YgiN